jgi:hypothetical protein
LDTELKKNVGEKSATTCVIMVSTFRSHHQISIPLKEMRKDKKKEKKRISNTQQKTIG